MFSYMGVGVVGLLMYARKGSIEWPVRAAPENLQAASATRNHFALADKTLSHLDVLFTLVMLLEIVAGLAW